MSILELGYSSYKKTLFLRLLFFHYQNHNNKFYEPKHRPPSYIKLHQATSSYLKIPYKLRIFTVKTVFYSLKGVYRVYDIEAAGLLFVALKVEQENQTLKERTE